MKLKSKSANDTANIENLKADLRSKNNLLEEANEKLALLDSELPL